MYETADLAFLNILGDDRLFSWIIFLYLLNLYFKESKGWTNNKAPTAEIVSLFIKFLEFYPN